VQAYQLLNQLISSRNFMVVIGPPYSGKSKMVAMLQDSGKM
jgi:ABC-type proline/glycine betaine transport system ATPase subunit